MARQSLTSRCGPAAADSSEGEVMDADRMDEIRQRYSDAVKKYGHHFKPRGLFGRPEFVVGAQGFGLDLDPEPEHDEAHREWLGIMLCAALERLVAEHTDGQSH